jgi:hypothetical protein
MASEHGFLLFTLTFLSIFFLVVAMIPASFLYASSQQEPFSEALDSFVLTKGDFHVCENITIQVGVFNYYLNVVWTDDTNHIGYGFGSFYPFIAFWLDPILDRDYILDNEVNGQIILTLSGQNETVFVSSVIIYNHTLYDSLIDAFDSEELLFYITDLVVTESYYGFGTGWMTGLSLIAQLLFFSAPNIDPTLNAIIAIPIWVAIAISIIIIWSMIKPF